MLTGVVHAQNERDIAYYSLFLEKDFQTVLVLEQKKTGDQTGFIKTFGGYVWFEKVFGDSTKTTLTPSCAAPDATTNPPDPAPMTSKSVLIFFISPLRYCFRHNARAPHNHWQYK